MTQGVLIGADQNAEKLLPWWWEHYSRHCAWPVAIVDFGMSKKSRAWCQKRMQIISLQDPVSITPQHLVASKNVKAWQAKYKSPVLWQIRAAWFKKPQACRLSPFEWTLWLDLDCEVCAPLDSLFAQSSDEIELAIAPEYCGSTKRFDKPDAYNSGVMLFRQGSPFLKEWEKRCQASNNKRLGDQDVLDDILATGKTPFKILSPCYNWLMNRGGITGIFIAHWVAPWGKNFILKEKGSLFKLTQQKNVQI